MRSCFLSGIAPDAGYPKDLYPEQLAGKVSYPASGFSVFKPLFNSYESGQKIFKYPFLSYFEKRLPWKQNIPADSSHIHSSGCSTPVAQILISKSSPQRIKLCSIACLNRLYVYFGLVEDVF